MRGGVLPPALLFAALAFALAFVPRGVRLPAIVAALVAAAAVSAAPLPVAWIEAIFVGCWTSVVVTAATIHLSRFHAAGRALAVLLAANAGAWAGAIVAIAGTWRDLVMAAPLLVLVVPAAWLVGAGRGIAVKVAASWLIAIALLAAVLPFVVATPGYAPDHME